MSILKAPPEQQKNVTLQVRIDGQLKAQLAQYVEFLKATESYVVSEALRHVFDRDRAFKEWAERRATNTPGKTLDTKVTNAMASTSAPESKATPKGAPTHDLFH
jgi:predicted transcriptional regulator